MRVGVASSAADETYAVEDAFELEMSTRVLSLDEAAQWLVMIAENEGVDHPHLSRVAMSRSFLGLAFVDEWCITVRKKKPCQLLLLHEMAHAALITNDPEHHGPTWQATHAAAIAEVTGLPIPSSVDIYQVQCRAAHDAVKLWWYSSGNKFAWDLLTRRAK